MPWWGYGALLLLAICLLIVGWFALSLNAFAGRNPNDPRARH